MTKLTNEERTARETLKAEKAAARAHRKAEKDAEKAAKVPHLAKIQKLAEKLPEPSGEVQSAFEGLTNTLDQGQLTALVAHLGVYMRTVATLASKDLKLEVGQMVKIVSGDARFLGQVARVDVVQQIRIRCTPVGSDTQVYLFAADVAPLEAEQSLPEETAVAVAV